MKRCSKFALQEVNNGCNTLEEQLKSACYLVSCSHDVRGRQLSVSSPTRTRSRSVSGVPDEGMGIAETPGRMQTEAFLAEWHVRLSQEKEQLAEAIQLLSTSVNNVRIMSCTAFTAQIPIVYCPHGASAFPHWSSDY
jgi:hypothetical protein